MWFRSYSSLQKFRRFVTVGLLLGITSPAFAELPPQPPTAPPKNGPVLDDSPAGKSVDTPKVAEPKRFAIPKHATNITAPQSMMEVPSPKITDTVASNRRPIELKDKAGKPIEDLRFGFMTASGEPLKDPTLKGKARKATAELLFGNPPAGAWWDSNNLLNIEGTPLKVVFVRFIGGQIVDFEEWEEEPKIEKQFADEVRAIFYQPRVRDLTSLSNGKKIYFGLTRNGFSIPSQNEEKALQEKIYRILQGEDVSTLSSEENGVVRLGYDNIGITFYYVDRIEGNTEVIEIEEPYRSNLLVAFRQQNRKVLIELREEERKRLVQVAKLKNQIKAQQALVEKGLSINQKKEERLAEITSIGQTLPPLIASLTKIQKNNEAETELNLAKELFKKMEVEEESLVFPMELASPKECLGYQLVQEKRTFWTLQYGTPKKMIAEWKAKPLWHNCNADLFAIAVEHGPDVTTTDSHWEVYKKGELLFKNSFSAEFPLTSAIFFQDEGRPQSVRMTVKDRTNVVTEYTPGEVKPRIRLLVGGEFDRVTKFRFWINGGNEVELVSRDKGTDTTIRKFQTVDASSFVGNSNQFMFKGREKPSNDSPQPEKIFAVRGLELVDLSPKLPANVAKSQWFETRQVYRFDIVGDQISHYEIRASDYRVLKRLSVTEECEKFYTFTVKAEQTDRVSIEAIEAPKLSIEVKKIKGIVCAGRRLALLAEFLHSPDGAVKLVGDKDLGQLDSPPIEDESSGSTLFILKSNQELVAYPALRGFSYSELVPLKDEGYQVKLKGPIAIQIQFDAHGAWTAPTKLGNPFSGKGMLVAQPGEGILFDEGQWIAATSKLTSLSKHGTVVSLVADDLQLNDQILEIPEGVLQKNFAGSKKLATIDGLKLKPPFVAPLELEGESISSAVLVKRGENLLHRIWLKENEDYGLLVSLDGSRIEAEKYRPFNGQLIQWTP